MKFERDSNRFYKNDENGKMIAEITFNMINDDSVYVIQHTFVQPEYRHEGIAAELVQAVVDEAVANNKMIKPVCPYAKFKFMQTPAYAKVWFK